MKRNTLTGRPSLPLLSLFVIGCLLAGCSLPGSSGGVFVWIDVPLDGMVFPAVQAIRIEGHASAPGGISRAEIWINGALLASITNPPMEGELASFYAEWTPPAPGAYTIQALAFGADGAASEPDSARVTFGDTATPTPVITDTPTPVITATPTPVITDTPTPVITDTPTLPPAGTLIQFWAEPATIAAGSCTTIRWHVENASRVVFGGVNQALDGSYTDCLCKSQRYTLTVTRLDGFEEKRRVDVTVTGSCVTPTVPPPSDTMAPPAPSDTMAPPAPPDTMAPPAPSLVVPANGASIACKAAQSLVWMPVSDPSGIASYQVQVQRLIGNNEWQNAPGGLFDVADKTASVPVDCGLHYRWRVRAVDGAGNVGPWSGWFLFGIILD